MIENYIVERINQLCDRMHMSQYELALRAGMTQSSLSNLMSRGSTPRMDTVEKICNGFGITLAQFFSSDDSFPDLTEDQKEMLHEWGSLSPKEKEVSKTIWSSVKSLRR